MEKRLETWWLESGDDVGESATGNGENNGDLTAVEWRGHGRLGSGEATGNFAGGGVETAREN